MSQPIIEVCLSPALLHLYDTKNTVVVVIDIFRATSTMAAALDNGAKTIIPVDNVEECKKIGAELENSITAGERDGKVIEGLQYGNSPTEYSPDFIKDKSLVLTTTNGTKLLHMVEDADHIIMGSFLNLSGVCDFILSKNQKTLLACAAWKDRVNMEDSLFAGAVLDRLQDKYTIHCDSGRMAKAMYHEARQSPSLIDYLKNSTHYQRLSQYGLSADLEYCTQVDKHNVVPVFKGKELTQWNNT